MPKYMMDLSVLVAQVREVAVEVGAFLREQRAAFDRSAVQEKGPHDYVSYVDKASEERLGRCHPCSPTLSRPQTKCRDKSA